MAATRALEILTRAGVEHRVHAYSVGEVASRGTDSTYGEAVAALLDADPARVFKTLVGIVDDEPVVAIVPVRERLSLKALAAAGGGKRAAMAEPADAERWTGYVVGGISPFGQKRKLPCFLDQSALGFTTIFVSAGRRGLQVEVAPRTLMDLLDAKATVLT